MDNWIQELFSAVDQMNADKFVTYLSEDAQFKFGNAAVVKGRDNIRKAVSDFFGTIKGLHHRILNVWNPGDSVISEIEVTYTRKDGKKVVVPCMNLFTMKGKKIRDYRIFIDISPVYS